MNLADCDQFVLMMKTAMGYDLRVKAIIFKNNYLAELDDIMFRIDRFLTCFFFIEHNKNFHKWLEIILAFGNYLNGTSNRGGAYGFRLDTLAKLSELKSSDNKKTLFYYIIEYIGDNKMEELFDILLYLEVFQGCKSLIMLVNLQAITENFKDVLGRFKSVCSLQEVLKYQDQLEPDDGTEKFIGAFLDKAKREVDSVEHKIKEIDTKYITMLQLFGDTPKDLPMETFIDVILKFAKDLQVYII
jgi:diaphanous 1